MIELWASQVAHLSNGQAAVLLALSALMVMGITIIGKGGDNV